MSNSKVTFQVFRYDPNEPDKSKFDVFFVPNEPGQTILEALFYILENLDPTLGFRSSCRAAVCGSCAMHINGEYRLACRTQVAHVLVNNTIIIRPLAHSPIIKDLITDLTGFFNNLKQIKPYLVNNTDTPEKERKQTPKERAKIDGLIDCLLCGSCYGSCPVAGTNPEYLGPHAFLKALRFIDDSRDTENNFRLNIVAGDKGVFRCHTIFNCQQYCPKDLDPAGAISKLKLKALSHKLFSIFK